MTNRPDEDEQPALPQFEAQDEPLQVDVDGDGHLQAGAIAPAPAAPDALDRLSRRTTLADLDDDWDEDGDVAPVVTDQGVYGTLPVPRQRLRDIEGPRREPREQWTRVAATVLALALGLWLVLYSVAQATSPAVALPAIERVVDSLTGLRGLLEIHEQDIRAVSVDPITVPGFEVDGITLSQTEVQAGDVDEWHAAMLRRTAEAVYAEGPGVLSNGEEQSGAGTFSTPGGARLLMSTLSNTNHDRASLLLFPLGLVALAAGAAVLAFGTPFGRFSSAGFAMLVAAFPAILVGAMGLALVTFIGSDGSRLAQEVHSLASDLAASPLRNGVTLFVMSLVVIIPARIATAVFARSRTREPVYDPAYD